MKYYKIVYTYYSKGIEEEEITVKKQSMFEALAYVRSTAHLFCLEDFCVRKVYVETEDGTAWAEVPDWADMENEYQRENTKKRT